MCIELRFNNERRLREFLRRESDRPDLPVTIQEHGKVDDFANNWEGHGGRSAAPEIAAIRVDVGLHRSALLAPWRIGCFARAALAKEQIKRASYTPG